MSFTEEVVEIIKAIPKGRVATYGQVARMAGNPRAARQVVRTLNTQTKKHKLPWHRMINAQGKIAIKDPFGADEQKALLLAEGVEVSEKYTISLEKYQWKS